ncbi:MAG: hypothetical protein IMHGJWDQ_001445 [Candidatus Fervidibacter sp.]
MAEDILHNLDEHMDTALLELDNWKMEWADTRLSMFRSGRGSWAIVFEFVGNYVTYADSANYIYIFGNCLQKQGDVGAEYYRYLFTVPENMPLETDVWIADKARFAILIAMLNNGLKDYNSGGGMSNEQKEA